MNFLLLESDQSSYLCRMNKQRIGIFASGTGSNAVNLINYFSDHQSIEVAFVLSNKETAKVLTSAQEMGIKTYFLDNSKVAEAENLIKVCKDERVNWIMLAGYLRKIPPGLIQVYPDRIINLHPALLPKFGGKGMYGMNVHQAVVEAKEKVTGITIHFVNEEFDKGEIIEQFSCDVHPDDTAEEVAAKIHELEQKNVPTVVEKTILRTL